MENPFAKGESPKQTQEEKPEIVKVEKLSPREDKKVELSPKMKILAKYNGIESDIPINSSYWKMKG